jgi:hypothetical protein
MWMAISAERARTRLEGASRRQGWFALPMWLRWVPAVAAGVVLGIALGRWTGAPGVVEEPGVAGAAAAQDRQATGIVDDAPMAPGYALATLNTLVSAEALLVGFPEDARAGRSADISGWALDLLTDTRLLADSPVGDDPELARLLSDLELLLAQIATLRDALRTNDVQLIEDGMNHNDMLVRLRAATGNGVAAGL